MIALRRLAPLVLALAAVLALPGAAAAYRFAIPEATLECTILPDASVRLHYRIAFENLDIVQPIDVVDIGLPTSDYDTSNMSASLNGQPLFGITQSSYVETGVEVPISPPITSAAVFEFEATIPDLVFSDTTNDAHASFQITPTWFDGSLLEGFTDIRVAIHLPPGVAADEVLHQGTEFFDKAELGDHALVGFRWPTGRLDEAHIVGISFPRRAMTRVVEISNWDLLEQWWEEANQARAVSGFLLLAIFAFYFIRWTSGTGWTLLLLMWAVFIVLFFVEPIVHLYSHPVFVVLFALAEWRIQKRKGTYLPPLISAEGGGIKRGLTAPEAAVLLELPLSKVLTLVLFGLLKKSLVRQVEATPLRLEIDPALTGSERAARRKSAVEKGAVIHGYEHGFLDTIELGHGQDVEQLDFGGAMTGLIEHVAERVLGFDLDETKKYYRQIVTRAWTEAESLGEAGDIAGRTTSADKNLEWLLMDDDYTDRFDGWGRRGHAYRPIWIRPPLLGAPSTGVGDAGGLLSAPTGGGGAASAPSFGDVAASFAGWTENVTGSIASAILPGSVSVEGAKGAAMDLSGVDKVTGDVLSAFFSGSGRGGGGGGGGGGGCACACAGCACACACAGGGR